MTGRDAKAWSAKEVIRTNGEMAKREYRTAAREKRHRLADSAYLKGAVALKHSLAALERLDAIAARLDALEAAGIKYCGTWQRAMDYGRGAVTTHKGSAWIALCPTMDEPGSSADWQLMVKRGRDA